MEEIRSSNSYSMPGGFNISSNEPIDSRMFVSDISHITDESNWAKVKPYNGLIVSDPNGEVRICINADNYSDESSWKKIGEGISWSILEE